MSLRSRPLLFVLAVLIVGPQCKRRTHGAGTDAGSDDEYMVVHDSKDGTETRVRLGSGPIPPEFPPGLQLYPGATFSSTARLENSIIVILRTTDSPEAVFAFYRKQSGYDETSDVTIKDKRVLSLKHRASGKELQIVVKVEDGRTIVSLVAHPA
ncbi:MAG: hypothetical protein ABIP39_06760 [Polyangiaceae bacterium]